MVENVFTGLKVLLVEDQQESRLLLRQMLNELGVAEIYEAADGHAALQFFDAASRINLVMCDWNMPEMTGIEFLQQVRKNGIDVPFMMITGRGDQNSVMEAKSTGVNSYIRKPYSPIQIEAKLRILMRRTKAA